VKRTFRIGERNPALDLVSYGRRGAGRTVPFTREQIAQIARTVRRTPEVMVNVSGGANTVQGVAAQLRSAHPHLECAERVLHCRAT
jgi:hypothetical protein